MMRELIPYAGSEKPRQRHGRGRLVPYAGFDPDENDFSDVTPAPLQSQDLTKPPRTIRTALDQARIWQLRSLKWTWDAIGKQLAIENHRRMPYRGTSVCMAARAKPR